MVLGSLTFEIDMVHNGLHSAAEADVVLSLPKTSSAALLRGVAPHAINLPCPGLLKSAERGLSTVLADSCNGSTCG